MLKQLAQPKTAVALEAFQARVVWWLLWIGIVACAIPWVVGVKTGDISAVDRYGLPVLAAGFLGANLWLRAVPTHLRALQTFVLVLLSVYSIFDFTLLSLPTIAQSGAGGAGLPWISAVLTLFFFNHSERTALRLGVGYMTVHLLIVLVFFRAGVTFEQFNVILQLFLANAVTLGMLRLMSHFRHSYQALYEIAHTDALTGIMNRRSMQSQLEQQSAQSRSFGVLMIDIDHFKRVNDTHGHGVGDQVLRELALLLEGQTRSQEIVSRWGGEEFMVLSGGPNREACGQIALRLLEAVRSTRLAGLSVTISIGVAWREESEPLESVMARADAALYAAKGNGRDRLELSSMGSRTPTQELPEVLHG